MVQGNGQELEAVGADRPGGSGNYGCLVTVDRQCQNLPATVRDRWF